MFLPHKMGFQSPTMNFKFALSKRTPFGFDVRVGKRTLIHFVWLLQGSGHICTQIT